MTDSGWTTSAGAWLAQMGDDGDWGRVAVLDAAMSAHLDGHAGRVLDIGCGEGRFVRTMTRMGFDVVGIDPTEPLIAAARDRDPHGEYHVAAAEALPFPDAAFDLCVSYLSLCDVEHLDAAIAEVDRVLKPGGTFLFANLSSINTAGQWERSLVGTPKHYAVDDYMEERLVRQIWAGINIVNWHRPFSTYFQMLLGRGFILKAFEEPMPIAAYRGKKPKFERVPNFVVMKWEKPE